MKPFKILSNKKTILILFLLFVGFNIYFFSQFKVLNKIAKQEVQILDLRFGYNVEEVIHFFNQIGKDGQLIYAKISKADMFYPLAYGLLLIALISYFAQNAQKYLVLNLLAILAIIIDWLENIFISKLNLSFPIINTKLVNICSLLTQMKWILVVTSILLILFLAIKLKLNRTKN